ncbi:class I SAM-dependent methyltransferase [Winogradskyella flava]|uniref:class I SAM-dependent methyltransferase n=1 Tax=Winogradskyella flava TaxID=1884876 RepID=UPI0024937EE9|nr:class I SAM-dependent methyltransferase [Winogradskyella flava]
MEQIYEKHLWGGENFDFYSGEGSHNPEIIKPYLEAVSDFLKSKNGNLTVCDLGCGDFNIGQHLVQYTKNYIAVDIVDSLIERNKTLFKANNLEFYCLDISKDELPKADCVILRQVLQHLSNEEIKNILAKLYNYKYVILTEHLPNRHFIPNNDKIASQGIRLKQNSGIDLTEVPFKLKFKEKILLEDIVVNKHNGRIKSILFRIT